LLERLLMWLRLLFGPRQLPAATRRRVLTPSEAEAGGTTLTGIARCASVEIDSAVSGERCLVFGLRGTVGEDDLADADGGDIDLELPSGERVMVSLEHAMLVADTPPAAGAREIEVVPGSLLASLLESRGVAYEGETASLEEHLVRDGDEITVTGEPLSGTVTSFGQRSGEAPRVLAGTEERPVILRAAASARRSRS